MLCDDILACGLPIGGYDPGRFGDTAKRITAAGKFRLMADFTAVASALQKDCRIRVAQLFRGPRI
jgi:hypothetical protein